MHSDAAITLATVLFLASQVLMNLMSMIYDDSGAAARVGLRALHFIIPQLTLFDASSKVVHSMNGAEVVWGALPGWVLWMLTGYAAAYVLLFLGGAFVLFRRRPL
jgi:ABC-type transport system involved in multi-copper enzyme maturation permease subunit